MVCTMAQQKYTTIIFGCGNWIMGDDGFGPEVVTQLNAGYNLPDHVEAVDAGTAVREYLFDYLLCSAQSEDGLPQRIILVDAVDFSDRQAGEVFPLSIHDIPRQKIHDFSLHQFPTVNLLAELEEYTTITVDMLVAQVDHIPDRIEPGLSPCVALAVPLACQKIIEMVSATRRDRLHPVGPVSRQRIL